MTIWLVPVSAELLEKLASEFAGTPSGEIAAKTSLYSVGKVAVFGSYVGNQDRLGDIDLAIRLDRRPEFAPRWPEALLARAEAAENHGRRFRGFLERLAWPETEVKRYLRGSVRSLSLHDWTKEGLGCGPAAEPDQRVGRLFGQVRARM